jgi:hypothetical protein
VVAEAGQLTAVTEAALLMSNVALPVLASWFASPAKLALAVAVPAFVLFVYDGVRDALRLPAPVAAAVHGVSGEPVYVVGVFGQVTVVSELALLISKVAWPVEPVWFASPPKLASAVAVPAFVLFV